MTTGVSDAGFQGKTLTEIFAEMETEILGDLDAELDTSEDAAIGQILRIASKKLAEGWELLDTAYSAFDESNAQGSLMEALAAFSGTYREAETYGLASIECTLAAGATITTAHRVGHATDETSVWQYKGPLSFSAAMSGVYPLTFECTRAGTVEAVAGTLTQILTPLAGWSSATNPADADPGAPTETIEDLRIRRREELRAQGGCTVPAQYADIIQIDGVISARVFENDSYKWVDGMPPKSVEVVIWDGVTPAADDAEIWECIYLNKPAGIETIGTYAISIEDASGNNVDLAFSRTAQIPITVAITVAIDASIFPGDGEDQIKAAIVAYGDALRSGNNAVLKKVEGAALSITGAEDIDACTLNGIIDNVSIGPREIAVFDTSAITVTLSTAEI